MSFGNLFVVLSSIGDIELDVVLNEEHDFNTRVTRNPVEDGSEFADNIVILPIVLNMTARVSDASMIPLVPSFGSRSIDAYYALVELQSSRELVDIGTGIRTYANMFIERITIPRQSTDGNSLRLSMTLSELIIAGDNAENNRDLISQDVQHSALPSANAGTVQKVLA